MKKTIIFLLTLCANTNLLVGQQKCDCKDYVENIIELIEKNYADRNNINKKKYTDAVKKIRSTNLNITHEDCVFKIYSLLSKLEDKHISFFLEQDSGTFMRTIYDSSETQALFNKFIKYQTSEKSIEGVWETDNRDLEYLIMKASQPRMYNVIIWNSKINNYKRGMLKGLLKEISKNEFAYISYGGSKLVTGYKMSRNGPMLYSFVTGNWRRQTPGAPPVEFRTLPSMARLSENTLLLKMPSFTIQNGLIIDSLVKNSILSKTEHLIIDVSTNLGGSIQAYRSIMPFLYTNPIRIESGIYYSSRDNIQNLKSTLSRLNDTTYYYQAYKKLAARLEENPGKLVIDTGYYYSQDSVYEYPKKVSILVGKRCASAGELFLISALQSKKVTLFGENSAGICDRLDAYSCLGTCNGLRMNIPISVRSREFYLKPIDNIGIPPHVRIPPNKNWLNYILNYKSKSKR